MSTLEYEVIEKFHQLDAAAQRRVRQIIEQEAGTAGTFDYEMWRREVEAIRQEIRQGNQHPAIDVVDLLRGIRDGEDE